MKPASSLSSSKGPAPLALGFSAEDFAAGDDDDTEQGPLPDEDKGILLPP